MIMTVRLNEAGFARHRLKPNLSFFLSTSSVVAGSSAGPTLKHQQRDYIKCYRTLKVPVDSSLEDVKSAFIILAKKFHPDGGSPDANAAKFQEVEAAYRTLQVKYAEEQKFAKPEEEMTEVMEFDIKHTAPQHRQYLSFGGFGVGTPFQREKQHQKMRAIEATDNVLAHRIHKINLNCSHNREEALVAKDKAAARKIKTKHGMDRLVEDLIQESMARGDFDNLSGKGRPLKKRNDANPYVDFVTHKINEVLIENGFTPEWITLQKEIREEREHLLQCLAEKRKRFGPLPLSPDNEIAWSERVEELQPVVKSINSKINKYNLLVPILQKQMLQVQIHKEAEKILRESKTSQDVPQSKKGNEVNVERDYRGDGDTVWGHIHVVL